MLKLMMVLLLNSSMALAENSVSFEGIGNPGFLTIEGKGGKVTSKVETKDGKTSGTFEVDLKAFDTGLSLRNTHMKEKYLEIQKFPKAVFVLDPVVIAKSGYFNWTGKLTLHGVTNKVSGVAFVDGKQTEAKFAIQTPDYKIKKAIYLGVGMDDKISIVVRFDTPG